MISFEGFGYLEKKKNPTYSKLHVRSVLHDIEHLYWAIFFWWTRMAWNISIVIKMWIVSWIDFFIFLYLIMYSKIHKNLIKL